ncbi:MAG: NAD(P)/FAD-dependent oxidoreductase [Rhodospirillales bacterium]|nr:NAD(P)/FAD-dependent oxidoreductase [Rhodospirillales bacterium]MBO6788309.1 NAD(P)/FAD-dependent oxidoreductase [Rhodospirillales bacterium]
MKTYDVIVLGAGAAGLMCAITAGGRGRSVLLLDHAEAPGKKILISGGGRCNFTNLHCEPENFLSANTHFCKSALARYTQHDFIALVDKYRIPWHEKTLGQLFCDTSASDIVSMLRAECDVAGVSLRLSHTVTEISKSDRFRIETNKGAFEAESVVLATGGLSIPKMGATGFTHDWAKRFGLSLCGVRPGLVPFTLAGADREMAASLSGVSAECIASTGKTSFREALLFTHKGFSGPAVLQISSYWKPGTPVMFDLAPDRDVAAELLAAKHDHPAQDINTVLGRILPARMAQMVTARAGIAGRIGETADRTLGTLAETVQRFTFTPAGTEGYAKAEVTAGGVDTAHLSSKTMEVKTVPGLFIIGEAVDVTGWLGGYNFQWAWSSGHAAGLAA